MEWYEIVSIVCIFGSAILFSVSLQGQTKLKILFVQMFATVLYLLNYIFVLSTNDGTLAGAITAGFEILRLVIFYVIESKEKFNTSMTNYVAMVFFSVALTVCSIFTWNGWTSIFPLVSAILVSIALGNKNVVFIKIAFIVQAGLITTYLLLISLWINAISQILVFIFGVLGLVRYVKA